ncbi:MAG: HDIG domain-containing protein [Muribaculaceae bacterium]|nr:HDIG domain-containing protein [Muribaculaceae bacterium]
MGLFTKKKLSRSLLFVAATFIIVYFLPRSGIQDYYYEINRPWSYSLLTAPFDIPVHLDSVRAVQVKDSIDVTFLPVFKRDTGVDRSVVDEFSECVNSDAGSVLSPSERGQLTEYVRRLFADGIVDQEVYSGIESGKLPYVRFIKGNVATNVPTSGYKSPRVAYATLDSVFSNPRYRAVIETSGLSRLLVPNVVCDTVASKRLRDELYRKAMAPVGVIQQGERIIDRGDIVTPQLYTVLKTYDGMMAEKGLGRDNGNIYPLLGQMLFVIILLAALYCYLYFFRRDMYDDFRSIVFIMLMVVGFTVLAFFMTQTFRNGLYVVPFTIIPIMMLIFFDARTGLFCHIITVMLCSITATFPLEYVFIQFIAGITAINSLKELSQRSQLIRTATLVFLAYSLSYVAVVVMLSGSVEDISLRMFGFFGINALFISFAYVLIFIFERLFGFTSMVTLVELSDINNPLLRELSEECPGTFQHSMSVSTLASDAALRVGANVQLVRAGALYHDIGKINNPAFFTENQHGVNPHDALSPVQSARVVIGHVTDGLKRAEKAKLPAVVRDFITEHHGHGKAKYFYNTYCNAHPDEEVDESQFTYPGPNPRSKETSILMMADSVEAASRSLAEHTPEAISSLVERIINAQIADGLHDDSPLSFRDVRLIKESFISRLRTMYHARISYPADPVAKK